MNQQQHRKRYIQPLTASENLVIIGTLADLRKLTELPDTQTLSPTPALSTKLLEVRASACSPLYTSASSLHVSRINNLQLYTFRISCSFACPRMPERSNRPSVPPLLPFLLETVTTRMYTRCTPY